MALVGLVADMGATGRMDSLRMRAFEWCSAGATLSAKSLTYIPFIAGKLVLSLNTCESAQSFPR